MTPRQMTASDDMRTFQALSYGEKWRVTRLVAKGRAPDDPRRAAAAVELAERYQRRRHVAPTLLRWLAIAVILGSLAVAILSAAGGDALLAITMALLVLTNVAHLAFNPLVRPQSVARSLEASRRVSDAAS